MTREEAIELIMNISAYDIDNQRGMEKQEALDMAIKALEQEPFINKPCVSEKVCEHDKNVVLGKIRAEIEKITSKYTISGVMGKVEWSDRLIKECEVLEIIDKYKAESENYNDGWCNTCKYKYRAGCRGCAKYDE